MGYTGPFDVDHCLQRIENRTHMESMRLGDWRRVGPIVRVYRVLSENIRNAVTTGEALIYH
jgi:hypothetical protein